jgi:dipeptide/tripeptide permease
MKKKLSLFVVVCLCLTAYAIYTTQRAMHRGELIASIVLMFIAVIFWNRVKKSSYRSTAAPQQRVIGQIPVHQVKWGYP